MTYSSPWRSMRHSMLVASDEVGHGKARANAAVQQRHQPARLVLRGAVAFQHLHVAGVGGRAVHGLGGQRPAAHDLAQRRIFQVGEAGAGLAVRQEHVPQPGGLGPVLQPLHGLRRLPGVARLAQARHLVLERGLGGDHVGLHEVHHALLQRHHLGGMRKVHAVSCRRVPAVRGRCGHLGPTPRPRQSRAGQGGRAAPVQLRPHWRRARQWPERSRMLPDPHRPTLHPERPP